MQLYFVVADYSAMGEGRTISILITEGVNSPEDEDKSINFKLLKEFGQLFGWHHYQGAEILDDEVFFKKYKNLIPESVTKSLELKPGGFKYFSQISSNFS